MHCLIWQGVSARVYKDKNGTGGGLFLAVRGLPTSLVMYVDFSVCTRSVSMIFWYTLAQCFHNNSDVLVSYCKRLMPVQTTSMTQSFSTVRDLFTYLAAPGSTRVPAVCAILPTNNNDRGNNTHGDKSTVPRVLYGMN